MTTKRTVEVFVAGCPACDQAVELVNRIACDSCEVQVLDMHKGDVAKRAQALGVRAVPAIAVNGKLASCCLGQGLNEASLREAGIGNQ